MANSPEDTALARYLVGECSETEQARLEEQFFASDATFNRLCEIEEEFVARYLRGELDPDERARFERAYGAGRRRDRIVWQLALHRYASEAVVPAAIRSPAPPERATSRAWWRRWAALEPLPLRFALASVGAVLAIALALVVRDIASLRSELGDVQVELEKMRLDNAAAAERAAELERRAANLSQQRAQEPGTRSTPNAASAAQPLVAAFMLSPGITRSTGEPERLRLPKSADAMRLQLDLGSDSGYKTFRAELRTAGGDLVWSQDGLQPSTTAWGHAVTLTVPAALAANGEHEVVLLGLSGRTFEIFGRYYFVLVRE